MPTLRELLGMKSKEQKAAKKAVKRLNQQTIDLLESLSGKLPAKELTALKMDLTALQGQIVKGADYLPLEKKFDDFANRAHSVIAKRDIARAIWEKKKIMVSEAESFSRDLVPYIKKNQFLNVAGDVDFIKDACPVAMTQASALEFQSANDTADAIATRFQSALTQWKTDIGQLPKGEQPPERLTEDIDKVLAKAADSGRMAKVTMSIHITDLQKKAAVYLKEGIAKSVKAIEVPAREAFTFHAQAERALHESNDVKRALPHATAMAAKVKLAEQAHLSWKAWEDRIKKLPFDLKRAKWLKKEGQRLGLTNVVANATQFPLSADAALAKARTGDVTGAVKMYSEANVKQLQAAEKEYVKNQRAAMLEETNKKIDADPNGPEAKLMDALGEKIYLDNCFKSKICMEVSGAKKNVMSEGEQMAVWIYTSNDYTDINNMLRGTPPADDNDKARLQTEIDLAVQGLKKLRVYKGLTMRGDEGWPGCDKIFQKGNIYEAKAFVSSAVGAGFPGKYQWTMISKTGRMVAGYSEHPQESEILFLPGTKFKVLDRKDVSDSRIELTLEEV